MSLTLATWRGGAALDLLCSCLSSASIQQQQQQHQLARHQQLLWVADMKPLYMHSAHNPHASCYRSRPSHFSCATPARAALLRVLELPGRPTGRPAGAENTGPETDGPNDISQDIRHPSLPAAPAIYWCYYFLSYFMRPILSDCTRPIFIKILRYADKMYRWGSSI